MTGNSNLVFDRSNVPDLLLGFGRRYRLTPQPRTYEEFYP